MQFFVRFCSRRLLLPAIGSALEFSAVLKYNRCRKVARNMLLIFWRERVLWRCCLLRQWVFFFAAQGFTALVCSSSGGPKMPKKNRRRPGKSSSKTGRNRKKNGKTANTGTSMGTATTGRRRQAGHFQAPANGGWSSALCAENATKCLDFSQMTT